MKVSVVIPAYNAERTIGETVARSLAQAEGSLEVEVVVVVLVEGGSEVVVMDDREVWDVDDTSKMDSTSFE